ncbi:MAG TPA: hypothetical protein VNH19_10855, partial [Candidatus Limnocylindrales bacterium]|nr:hypothetical protein [Candidatus Limnocylindrales bacterium]
YFPVAARTAMAFVCADFMSLCGQFQCSTSENFTKLIDQLYRRPWQRSLGEARSNCRRAMEGLKINSGPGGSRPAIQNGEHDAQQHFDLAAS